MAKRYTYSLFRYKIYRISVKNDETYNRSVYMYIIDEISQSGRIKLTL